MQITVSPGDAREASYVVAMFTALHRAMTENPPPLLSSTIAGYGTGLAQSLEPDDADADTGTGDATNGDAANGDAAQASGGSADTGTGGKKRGRKSNAEKAREEAEAKAQAEKLAALQKPGAVLQGMTAQGLQAALQGLPLAHAEPGLEVRVAPGTPAEDIAALGQRLADPTGLAATAATTQATAAATVLADVLGTAPAAQASPAATQTATITALADVLAQAGTPAAGPAAAGPAAGGDTDLAAMLRKPKAAETAPAAGVSRFRGMSEDQLLNELAAYINNGGGLWYARTVLEKAGVDSLDDLTAEQMIDALENPNKFKQQPAA